MKRSIEIFVTVKREIENVLKFMIVKKDTKVKVQNQRYFVEEYHIRKVEKVISKTDVCKRAS